MTTKRIELLLIDDDEIDREHIHRLLKERYLLRSANSGKAGLAALAESHPDLLLLDYRLPDMDSFELLGRFVDEEIPVIVLTGEESPQIIVAAMQQGAENYLIKAKLTTDGLSWAINSAIEKADLRRSVYEQQRQLSMQAKRLAEQNQEISTLASALTLAEQRERKRIGRLLHDHIQQLLYGIQARLHLIAKDVPDSAPPALTSEMVTAIHLIQDAITAARSLAVDLSPPILKDEGVGVALQWLVTQMAEIHGLQVDLVIDTDYRTKQEELHVLIFQLVRELLFNVVKHANVKAARVHMFFEDHDYKIVVEDEGIGFDAGQVVQPKWKPEQGYGLYSVRERLALFGGHLDIDSHPNNGARITIILPQILVAA